MAGFDPITGEFIPDDPMAPNDAGHADFLAASPGSGSTPEAGAGNAPPSGDVPEDFRSFLQRTGSGAVTHPALEGHGSGPAPVTDPSQMQSQSAGYSVGSTQSYSGITDNGRKQAGQVFDPRMAQADQMNQQEQQHYANVQAATGQAYDELHAANAQVAEATKQHYANEQEINRQFGDFLTMARQAEELATAEASKRSDQYIAAYTSEMATVRQLMMQSGNPLGGLTAIQGGALAAATFAQGFLGARYGIKIDVIGQINSWVDQEMRAHQTQVQNLTAAAQGQLKLYDIARQQGLDEAQTRMRLRGFVIDGFKSSMQMEAARYQSATAMADAQAKSAQLDLAQLANIQAMWKDSNDRMLNNIRTMSDVAYKEASTARENLLARSTMGVNAAQAAKLRAETAKTKKETEMMGAGTSPVLLPDLSTPEMVGDRVAGYPQRWVVRPQGKDGQLSSAQNKAYDVFMEQNQSIGEITEGLRTLRAFRAKYGDSAFTESLWSKIRGSAEEKWVRAAYENVIASYRKAKFGAAQTATEMVNLEKLSATQPWFAAEKVFGLENLLGQQIATAQRVAVANIPGAEELPSGGPIKLTTPTNTPYDAAVRAQAGTNAPDTAVDVVMGRLQTSAATDIPDVSTRAPKVSVWKEWPRTPNADGVQPTYYQGHQDIEILAGIAKRGYELGQPEKTKSAVDALKQIASGEKTVKGLSNMQAFAAFALRRLDEEIGGARALPGFPGSTDFSGASVPSMDQDPSSVINTQVPVDAPVDYSEEIRKRNRERGY